MKHQIYTIFDKTANESGKQIILSKNTATAERMFFKSFLPGVPEELRGEYDLVRLGTFDDETLVIESKVEPLHLELPEELKPQAKLPFNGVENYAERN